MYISKKEIKEHFERASKFYGIQIDDRLYVTQAQAICMVEVSRNTFKNKCKRYDIRSRSQANGRVYYDRQQLLDAIEKGWFEKYV